MGYATSKELDELWERLGQELQNPTGYGEAAKALLAAGIPIHYRDDAFPGEIVKEYPDGRREIVKLDSSGNEVVVRKLD